MAKFHKSHESENDGSYVFWCPGCDCGHGVTFKGPHAWTVTGVEQDRPTVSPSILATGQRRCHSYVKDGMIQFLGDSEHSLVGQTVQLPDWPFE